MKSTRIVIEKNKLGNTVVDVINDEMTQREKTLIKYEVYKNINPSYQRLLEYLPQTDGNDK